MVSVQNMYSYDNRKWESVLEYCEETGKAFIPWYPLNGGNVEAMKKIEQVADKTNATPHQVALSWLLHHSPNILLIPGTSRCRAPGREYQSRRKIVLTEDLLEGLEGTTYFTTVSVYAIRWRPAG